MGVGDNDKYGCHTWWASVSKSVENGQKLAVLGQHGCLGCPWRGPIALQPTWMMKKHF